MLDRVAEQAQVAVSWGEAGVCCIVRTLSSSRQTPHLLEQVTWKWRSPSRPTVREPEVCVLVPALVR